MIDHNPNGRPVLLDHNGKPIRYQREHRDGEARPAGIALPHGWTFLARYRGGYNTYWHDRFDEAMRHSRQDAEAMRRDCYLMSLIQERSLAVVNLNWHLETPDERDKYQTQVKDGLTRLLKGTPFFRNMLLWWLEALWYGRHAVQVEWEWQTFQDGPAGKTQPRRGLVVAESYPVNGDKIGHQEDHTPYVLVNSAKVSDLPNAEIITTTLGRALSLRGTWRDRFIIHRHLCEDMDFFAPEQAEAIHGVGIRSKVFWTNFLKMEWLGNISDFFDKVGLGVTVWKYQAGNANALAAVKQAALEHSSRAHIFVPVSPDGGKDSGTSVERIEIPTSGADALGKLIEMTDRYLERYIVGQEGSSRGSSSGIGNEASAEFMMDTKGQITKFDANNLAETITGSDRHPGMVNTSKRWTYPDADFPVKFVFDVENPQSDKKVQAGKTIIDMGISIKTDEMRAAAGFSKPAEGDETIKPPQQQGGGGMPGMPGAAPGGVPGADPASGMGGPESDPSASGGDFLQGLQSDAGVGVPGAGDQPGSLLQSLQQARSGSALRYGLREMPNPPEVPEEDEEGAEEPATPAETMARILGEIARRKKPVPGGIPWADEIDLDDDDPYLPARYARGVLRYSWENRGQVGTSATGLPLYRYVNTDTHEHRVQHAEPGTGAESRTQTQEKIKSNRQSRLQETLQKPAEVTFAAGDEEKARTFLAENLGLQVAPEHLPELIGLPTGSQMAIYSHSYGPSPYRPASESVRQQVSLQVDHPLIDNMSRTLELRGDGDLVMHNNAFFAKKEHRGGGFGLKVFSSEVRACQLAGVDRIETTAGRGSGMNGYYTWPRMGYNAELEEGWVEGLSRASARAKMRAAFVREATKKGTPRDEAVAKAKNGDYDAEIAKRIKQVQESKPQTVLDVMATPVGQSVWSGCGTMMDMVFDLSPGSRSLQTLNAYLQSKGLDAIDPPSEEIQERSKQQRQKRKAAAARLQASDAQAKERQQRQDAEIAAQFRTVRDRYAGYAARVGLDAGKLRDAANERYLYPHRYGISMQGLTNLQLMDAAYARAYDDAVFERHHAIMHDPALEGVRKEAATAVDPEGLLYGPGLHTEARRQGANSAHIDPAQETRRAYDAARSYFTANLRSIHNAYTSLPESIRERAEEIYRQGMLTRRDHPEIQHGSDDPLNILHGAYSEAVGEVDYRHPPEQEQGTAVPHRKLLAAVQYLRERGKPEAALRLLSRFGQNRRLDRQGEST